MLRCKKKYVYLIFMNILDNTILSNIKQCSGLKAQNIICETYEQLNSEYMETLKLNKIYE